MGYRKLGRTSAQRKALLRDLATDLIIHERIETTEARAKELRSVVEKMITLGKRGDLHARRQAASYIRNEVANAEDGQDAVQKLFSDIAARYEERQGGYTRIMKMGPRRGDGAPVVVIELV
ncbi:50S ribosomal protein L17 [Peribacillus cavernae]|uniref:Large ribosomal subunit protein bL17 n=1 Tax=Peribacillus cavernae TaxID=1674310 RepID=A0A433HG73_9BACI|nr:50S ribosomal protein L17 [Peribacillus cavernae]MDQ0220581.1 large subunit ribosomal protein L17 [Peribacillus cavernae]RUQ27357.1 50S ribosomal protein L17 [Peribacillus cavernae]